MSKTPTMTNQTVDISGGIIGGWKQNLRKS